MVSNGKAGSKVPAGCPGGGGERRHLFLSDAFIQTRYLNL